MPIQVSDYIFPTAKFSMEADGLLVADFDVQTFGGGKWPVVACTTNGKTTWSVYDASPVGLYPVYIFATREEGSDGNVEEFRNHSGNLGALALPASLEDGRRWTFSQQGTATYTSPTGSVEHGAFTYKNTVWLAPHNGEVVIPDGDDLLYWLEDYVEQYPGSPETRYLRLHCYERGKGLIWYADHEWQGGTKVVTRKEA